ncbi:aminotransferase class I/II-fold pyridoxal phosphate-dependent enzyme [Cytobacillus depressus]|uniref:Aminotransferase n=1 Tax=Cytobacillus depressus TaxID=1602942 RepID=A0A6L3V8M2_9BACI|nr:LL-diaminopimelate aminotransferase [Cytobacillus depressus]KAB2333295.1 aminotransferase class I/II-fold pyridoxal phosphate-dependent enzyme [Cytobacillus depressus]
MVFQSDRVGQIPPYLFAEINKKKEAMIQTGIDVIDLGIGDPDLPTPNHIVEKLIAEMQHPLNFKYPSFIGHEEFRKSVADYYEREYKVKLDPKTEVLALIGSKEGIGHLIPALIDPGDVVLIPDPSYPVYRMATHLASGESYSMLLKEENNFEPEFDSIPKDILTRSKLMFLNYPGNPTAATVDLKHFERAVSFAKENQIPIAHDSAYNMVTFDGYKAPSILQAEGAKEIAVEFGSLSKTYNMTGWRIGYVVGNKDIIKSLAVLKSNMDTGQFTPIQLAAAHALNSDQSCVSKHNQIYKERMEAMIAGLASIGIKVDPPKGSFFIWAPVPEGFTSTEFATSVLEQTGVIITPGNAFGSGGEGYFRVSLSVPTERLYEAIDRIKQKLKIKIS